MSSGLKLAEQGELEPMLRQALAWIEQHGLGVFWGRVEHDDGFLRAAWDVDIVPEVEGFLVLAKTSGTRVVFVDCVLCDSEGLREAADESESVELRELVSKLGPHRGQLVEVNLSWVSERTLFELGLSASWADDYLSAWKFAEEGEEEEDDEEGTNHPDEEEVRRHALALAQDPKFQSSRSDTQRAYAARHVVEVAVRANKELLAGVIQEAKSIFELDIKPKAEQQIADEVEKLKGEGLTKSQIARRLGISANKMKTMF